ncbi:MAG: DUF4494 domain-containing protein [Bacteroidota bacterium]|nr:DUF4494 domain-containing protein [Bacteroidota bacterium]
MNTWFECKVKYQKIDENGKEKKVNEAYMIDAISFTEAETRIYKELETMISGEFNVTGITKSKITEVVPSETGDRWFKCKLSLLTIDESSGKEKKATQQILVLAEDVKDAFDKVEKSMDGIPVDFTIPSVFESTILEVFPYLPGESFNAIQEHIRPESAPHMSMKPESLLASDSGSYDMQEEEEEGVLESSDDEENTFDPLGNIPAVEDVFPEEQN